MRLKSNCGTMKVSHEAMVNGYRNSVCFSENAITNIIELINLCLQYFVTYRSNDTMSIIHRESEGKPNINFIMHDSGMHYFDPRDEEFTFLTLSLKTKKFSQRDR